MVFAELVHHHHHLGASRDDENDEETGFAVHAQGGGSIDNKPSVSSDGDEKDDDSIAITSDSIGKTGTICIIKAYMTSQLGKDEEGQIYDCDPPPEVDELRLRDVRVKEDPRNLEDNNHFSSRSRRGR